MTCWRQESRSDSIPIQPDLYEGKWFIVFSTNLSHAVCSQPVLNQCGSVLNESEREPGLILN
jgi:hypothetical protein